MFGLFSCFQKKEDMSDFNSFVYNYKYPSQYPSKSNHFVKMVVTKKWIRFYKDGKRISDDTYLCDGSNLICNKGVIKEVNNNICNNLGVYYFRNGRLHGENCEAAIQLDNGDRYWYRYGKKQN